MPWVSWSHGLQQDWSVDIPSVTEKGFLRISFISLHPSTSQKQPKKKHGHMSRHGLNILSINIIESIIKFSEDKFIMYKTIIMLLIVFASILIQNIFKNVAIRFTKRAMVSRAERSYSEICRTTVWSSIPILSFTDAESGRRCYGMWCPSNP